MLDNNTELKKKIIKPIKTTAYMIYCALIACFMVWGSLIGLAYLIIWLG
jgi:hypothetical protein